MREQTEAQAATIAELAERLASARPDAALDQPDAAPAELSDKEKEALHNRIHIIIERLVNRGVSGNEQLGKGLSFTVMSVPSLIQHVAQELNKPPQVLWGGLPLPADLSAFLTLTVRAFRAWVIKQL